MRENPILKHHFIKQLEVWCYIKNIIKLIVGCKHVCILCISFIKLAHSHGSNPAWVVGPWSGIAILYHLGDPWTSCKEKTASLPLKNAEFGRWSSPFWDGNFPRHMLNFRGCVASEISKQRKDKQKIPSEESSSNWKGERVNLLFGSWYATKNVRLWPLEDANLNGKTTFYWQIRNHQPKDRFKDLLASATNMCRSEKTRGFSSILHMVCLAPKKRHGPWVDWEKRGHLPEDSSRHRAKKITGFSKPKKSDDLFNFGRSILSILPSKWSTTSHTNLEFFNHSTHQPLSLPGDGLWSTIPSEIWIAGGRTT